MNFLIFHPRTKERKVELLIPVLEHNSNEGGEFLDDAIRMKEQSLIYTDERIAAIDSADLFDYSAE